MFPFLNLLSGCPCEWSYFEMSSAASLPPPPSSSPPGLAIVPGSPRGKYTNAATNGTNGTASYLKGYPYLFVRETDQVSKNNKISDILIFLPFGRFFQTDYFCTLCESYLKEEELQSHLFEGHQAESVEDSFVKVSPKPASSNNNNKHEHLHICVVCWAKIPRVGGTDDLKAHRTACRTDPADDDLENGSVPMAGKTNAASAATSSGGSVTNVVSTPDIGNLLSAVGDQNSNDSVPGLNGGNLVNGAAASALASAFNQSSSLSLTPLGSTGHSKRASRKKQSAPTHLVNGLPSVSPSSFPSSLFANTPASLLSGFAAQRLQCSLCSMVIPSPGYLVHLRDFHRVTCSLDDSTCPLCLSPVPVLELSFHLTAMHAIAPTSAVNSILVSPLVTYNYTDM